MENKIQMDQYFDVKYTWKKMCIIYCMILFYNLGVGKTFENRLNSKLPFKKIDEFDVIKNKVIYIQKHL